MTVAPLLRPILVGSLLLILSAGPVGIHTHQNGTGKSCTLCQAPHLKGSTTQATHVARPVECQDEILPGHADVAAAPFAAAPRSRSPPQRSTSV